MMYLHYCSSCDRIHMLSGHKTSCPACGNALAELTVSFLEYENMSTDERLLCLEYCRLQKEAVYR